MVISSVMSFNSAPESQSFREITPNLQLFHLVRGKCPLNGAYGAQWYWHWWGAVDGFLAFPHMGITSPNGQMLESLMPGWFLFKETRNSQ